VRRCYALALAASAYLFDKTYTKQLKAEALLENLFVKYPHHPGLAHYIIHAYDEPALAPRAAVAARRYGEIAPSTPHALHMPSHTEDTAKVDVRSVQRLRCCSEHYRIKSAVCDKNVGLDGADCAPQTSG
jgi:hypothetical protein